MALSYIICWKILFNLLLLSNLRTLLTDSSSAIYYSVLTSIIFTFICVREDDFLPSPFDEWVIWWSSSASGSALYLIPLTFGDCYAAASILLLSVRGLSLFLLYASVGFYVLILLKFMLMFIFCSLIFLRSFIFF